MLLVTDLERGGTPLRLAKLAQRLQRAGVEVFVGCLAPPGPVSATLAAAAIPTFACDARDARDWRAVRRLAQHVRRIRPDLIHATLTHANVAARLVGLAQRIPVVTSTATIELERRWHRWAERLTGRLDRGHVVNSVTLARHVIRAFHLPSRHVHVIPPALEPRPPVDRAAARAALDIPPHEFVVLWAGRFDPVKRIDLVIRAAEIMNIAPVRFLLAGDGPDRPRIERELRLSAASRNVRLLGWCDDLGPLLAAADALLLPSRTEGMPNVVLHAMAAGLPVVASDIPTLRELAGDEPRLILVPGDQPRPLAEALLALWREPERRRDVGRRAAAWAATALDPEASAAALLRVYRSVLCQR